jgi:hypothetical protein
MVVLAGLPLGPLSSPLRVDDTPALGPSASQQEVQVTAFDGGWLLGWTDKRSSDNWPDIYATALFADGGQSSLSGVRVGSGLGYEDAPDVACGASVCLLVFNHRYLAVQAVRFRFDGTPLDDPPLVIAGGAGPTVAWTGSDFAIAWSGSGGIYTARLSEGGAVTRSPALTMPTAQPVYWPSVASDGVSIELGWQTLDPTGLCGAYVARVAVDGGLLDTPLTLAPSATGLVLTGAKDGGYLVSTSAHDVVTGATTLVASRIENGALIDTPAFAVGARPSGGVYGIGAAFGDWALADIDYSVVELRTFAPDAGALAVSSTQRAGAECAHLVQSGSLALLVTCDAALGGAPHLWAAPVGAPPQLALLADAGRSLMRTGAQQRDPLVALDDEGVAVAWVEEADQGFDVRARHFGLHGTPDGPAVDLAAGPGAQHGAAIAWDGQAFDVAWVDDAASLQTLWLRRFDRSLSPLGPPQQLATPASIWGLAMQRVPDGVQLLWSRYEAPARMYLTHVTSDGGVSGGDTHVAPFGAGQDQATFAASDAGLLIAWVDGNSGQLYSARTRFDGTELEMSQVTNQYSELPAVASDGDGWLIAWHLHNGAHRLVVSRIANDGTVLDNPPLELPYDRTPIDAYGNAGSIGFPLSVVFDGDCYRVLWNEQSADAGVQIRSACVDRDGGVSAPRDESHSPDDEEQPVAQSGFGALAVVWRRFDSAVQAGRIELEVTPRQAASRGADAGGLTELSALPWPASLDQPQPAAAAAPRRMFSVGCSSSVSAAPGLIFAALLFRRRRPSR